MLMIPLLLCQVDFQLSKPCFLLYHQCDCEVELLLQLLQTVTERLRTAQLTGNTVLQYRSLLIVQQSLRMQLLLFLLQLLQCGILLLLLLL